MQKKTSGEGNELVLRHLLYHKKSTVIIFHMYMLLWADPSSSPICPPSVVPSNSKLTNYLMKEEELEEVAQD